VDIPAALTLGDGPWILVLTGAVLVFSFVGLVWAVSSADLARYQRSSGSGAASMLWSTFGATIPAFVLIAYGAVLAASNPDVALGLVETPLDTIALLIPIWYPIPLIAALAFSLLSGVVISIYSGGFALQAAGASMRRAAAVVIVGVAVAALAVLIAVSVGDFALILRDVATSLAVPIAGWAGIFGAEMMIRNKRFVSESLVKRGGIYADFRWLNLSMLIVATGIGFGLTTASVVWLGWQGYLFGIMGVPLSSDLAGSDLGVFVALVIGLFTPIVAGIPGIRRQEAKDPQRSQVAAV
jgi:purine-cytosine permease-like protein